MDYAGYCDANDFVTTDEINFIGIAIYSGVMENDQWHRHNDNHICDWNFSILSEVIKTLSNTVTTSYITHYMQSFF